MCRSRKLESEPTPLEASSTGPVSPSLATLGHVPSTGSFSNEFESTAGSLSSETAAPLVIDAFKPAWTVSDNLCVRAYVVEAKVRARVARSHIHFQGLGITKNKVF